MARTTISRTTLPAAGLNLTDATFSTLATGAGNGIEVPFRLGDVLVLKNDTGGAAVFTVKVKQPADFVAQSITVPDKTFSVANNKTYMIPLATVFKQTDSDLYVDCDVAGKVLQLAVSG